LFSTCKVSSLIEGSKVLLNGPKSKQGTKFMQDYLDSSKEGEKGRRKKKARKMRRIC